MSVKKRIEDICGALQLLLGSDVIAELRVVKTDGSVQLGIFDDWKLMAEAASGVNGTGNIYCTLNPVRRSRNRTAKNGLGKAINAVKDVDILRRRWLLLDFDVVRESDTPASDEQHEAAIETARDCRAALAADGWPEPILFSSGNGVHVLYSIDLPNDQPSTSLVRSSLGVLSLRFSREDIRLDTKTFNAARLIRVPFTINCKGKNGLDQLPRRAKLLENPETLGLVTREQLARLSAAQSGLSRTERGAKLEVASWVSEYSVPVSHTSEWNGGKKWILERCPWNYDHQNKSAYIVQFPDGGIAAGCLHNSCGEKNWPDLRAIYEKTELRELQQGEQKATQSARLIDLVESDISLFRAPQGESYVTFRTDRKTQNHPVNSEEFKQFLRYAYFRFTRTALKPQAAQEAVLHFDTLARFEGNTECVYLRTGTDSNRNYLDLANARGQVIEFSKDGWSLIENPPIRFRRVQGMLPLPTPVKGGDIQDMREFLNIPKDEDWLLFITVLVASLFPKGPYPVLGLHGQPGCGKTTAARISRKIVDPNAVPARGIPNSDRDLMIAANNGWQLSFDNLSFLPPWFSDCLCRLASGAGFSTRRLYTDAAEMLFEGQRPIVLNGIEELATRTDLLDRSIVIELPVIQKYRAEQEFWDRFDATHPKLFGCLLDIAVQIMNQSSNVRVRTGQQLRMADFVKLGTAAETALGFKPDAFVRAYVQNREMANAVALDASPIANSLIQFADEGFAGTATQLLSKLEIEVPEDMRAGKSWPGNPKVLSGMLKRLNPALKTTAGVEVDFSRDETRNRNRIISIRRMSRSKVEKAAK